MRPTNEIIIRIDDVQERTQITEALKTIIGEVHSKMANHTNQKYLFEYDTPNDYSTDPGGYYWVDNMWGSVWFEDGLGWKYGSYSSNSAGSLKSIYEKGNDTDQTTTYGRVLNDKGEEIEFRNYGPFGYNDFFAREGDYIVTRYMKIKPNGHIYLTFETNTTRYGSIISQGRVTFKL
jgi:hypothetical protein